MVLGIVIAALVLAGSVLLLFAAGGTAGDWAAAVALGAPVLLLVAGFVLALIPRTSRTGAGLLIGFGGGILVAGGLCIALLTALSG